MKRWIVYTDLGDYHDIFAPDKWTAMRKVEGMTLNRVSAYDAQEVPYGR